MIAIRQSRHGFTLVEVLVSMTLGMLVVILAGSMLGRTRDDYERVGGGIAAEREARAVLTQLTADLHSAAFHKDCVFEQSHAAWPGDRLAFLSLQAPDAQSPADRIGDLCAIHYYLKDLVIGGKTVRCLMRGVRQSNDTLQALRLNQTPSLFTASPRDEPVAIGILAFEARPQIRNQAGLWLPWLPTMAQAPSALAVRLVIARHELAAKLTNAAAWDGNGTTAGLLGKPPHAANNRNLQVYSSLIRFAHPEPGL